MPEAHAKFSASGFEAATLCPGKRVMEAGLPDTSSKYADEGTAAHQLLQWCVDDSAAARDFLDTPISVNGKVWKVTEEMAAAVQTALDNIHEIVGDGMLLSEQRVNYSATIGVPTEEGWGTSDIIAASGNELQVHDYKHGMGVQVDAEENVQMKLYGLGALEQCQGILGDFETVRLVIHQPRIKAAPSEWVTTPDALKAWGLGAARSSVCSQLNAEQDLQRDKGWRDVYLRPNEKSCKFCKAKATCPALRDEAADLTMGFKPADVNEFAEAGVFPPADDTPADWLAAAMAKADLIEDWLKAVRAEVERRLLAGQIVPGFKVVQGKRGNRAWANATDAEELLKGMRLKVEDMYDLKLISPTTAEKLAKPAKKEGDPPPLIGPRQWTKVQALITQSDGKPHVAPDADPRPALDLRPAADDFSPVAADTAELA